MNRCHFQWSCHVETAPGVVTHAEFLGGADAPMRAFIDTLLRALGTHGAIFVYSPYEKTILNATAARFPDTAAAIENIIARMVDLLPLTRDNYYHPDMRGSWSLKAVLPCIAPQLAYQDLGEVQDGGAAGSVYCEMFARDTEPSRAAALDADLRAYCKLDTEALVELARFLCGGIRPDAARPDARFLCGGIRPDAARACVDRARALVQVRARIRALDHALVRQVPDK